MGRRRRSRSAFSLFSFQDIITSVTAILILIVLILSLELVARKSREAAASATVTRAGLEAAIADLQALAERLEAQASARPRSAAAPRSAADLERDVWITREQVEQALDDRATAERIRQAAVGEARAAEARRQAARAGAADAGRVAADADATAGEAARVTAANEGERRRLEATREQQRDRPDPGTELVFNVPADDGRQPWLLEVSVEGYAALALGTGKVRKLGSRTDGDSSFARWAASLRREGDYVLLLVRPSGTERFGAARDVLEREDIAIGIDFIGESQTVRDGVTSPTGAATGGPVEAGR